MLWQDIVFGIAGSTFIAANLPALLNPRTQVPRRSSLLTGTMLIAIGYAEATLGLYLATATSSVNATCWLLMAWRRPLRVSVLPAWARTSAGTKRVSSPV